jgi:hypothetical protein
MNRTEWEACNDPDLMLGWVGWGRARGRQQFALAVCWEVDRLIGLGEEHRRDVVRAEQELYHAPLRHGGSSAGRGIDPEGDQGRRVAEMIRNACLGQAVEVARQARWVLAELGLALPFDAAAEHRAWQVAIARDLFDPLFVAVPRILSWLDDHPEVENLARVLHADGAFADLPVLGDALEEAGCDAEVILEHCRSGGPHVRGCWAVEVILGRW